MDQENRPVLSLQLPRYAELPTMGLYLKQVTDYLNTRLAPLVDVRLTGTMVSNYVKHHLIAGPQKRLYGQDQLADLFFIAAAKNILPLDNLRIAIKIQQNSRFDRATAHDYFCQELEAAYQLAFFGRQIELPSSLTDQQRMLHHLALAIIYKASVDQYFEVTCGSQD